MTKFFKFFCASARDLNMQTLTVDQIADKMTATSNEQAMRLPRSFAASMRNILDVDKKTATDANQKTMMAMKMRKTNGRPRREA